MGNEQDSDQPIDLYPETPFAKEVREYVEGLHKHILELSKPIIENEQIIGYSCKVHFWAQTSYEKGAKKMIRRISYKTNFTHFVCIEQVKAFIDEITRQTVRLYLETSEFEASNKEQV